MLQITFDLFSGQPNPSWSLDDEAADEVLAEIARHPGAVSRADDFPVILGFRGVELHLSDELSRRHGLPRQFRIAAGRAADEDAGLDLAERLLETVPRAAEPHAGLVAPRRRTVPDARIVELLREEIRSPRPPGREGQRASAGPGEGIGPGEEEPRIFSARRYEAFGWDPARWNTLPYRARNNCYCFGTDQRIDYFGWPGYGSTGSGVVTPLTTPQMTAAIQSDGAVPRDHGAAASLRPRHMFAMVIGWLEPGGYTDYHFYRQLAGGVWGHKPGNAPATTTDDAGNTIYDPESCSRRKYPVFCGYFYTQSRMRIGGDWYPEITPP